MLKSVKAIIIVSMMVSMSMMLINSCGVSSPTSSNGNTGVSGPLAAQTTPAALTLNPANKSPLPPVLADIASKSPAAIPYLFDPAVAPRLNPNANSPNKKPFSQLCGTYDVMLGCNRLINTGQTINSPTSTTGWSDLEYKRTVSFRNQPISITYVVWHTTSTSRLNQPTIITSTQNEWNHSYPIPCNLFPPGMDPSLPDDLFAGNGLPAGLYAMPDGSVWEVGTDPVTGNPVITNHGKQLDAKGNPLYPPGYYPPAGGTNPPPTQPPGTTPPPVNPNPPPASGAQLMSLLIEPMDVSTKIGKVVQFNVTGIMTDGNIDTTINNSNVSWSSSDANIAMIYNGGTSSGKAWGKGQGNADITASYTKQDGQVIPSNVAVVHVGNQLQAISVLPAKTTIYLHPTAGTQQYTATGAYSDGSTKPVASPVTWDTLPGGIASVDSTGKATAVAPGTTYITAASDSATSGLNDAELTVECRQFTYYAQTDYGNLYDHKTDKTIAQRGCALTCMAMVATTAGYTVTPDILNTDMFANVQGADVNWGFLTEYTGGKVIYEAGMSNVVSVPFTLGNTYSPTVIDNYLSQCKTVVVGVAKKATKAGYKDLNPHFVLITGKHGNIYTIYDPYKAVTHATTLDGYYGNVIYSYIVYTIN